MLMTKMLQMIDKSPDIFKQSGCKANCVKSPCYCKNNDAVTRYVLQYIYISTHIVVSISLASTKTNIIV